MKTYYLYRNYGYANDAGPKAKKDINSVLKKEGFEKIDIYIPKNKYLRPIVASFVLKNKLSHIKNSLLFSQYPLASRVFDRKLAVEINHQRKKNHNIYVTFIHDLESLRYHPNDLDKVESEIEMLNKFDILICHNEVMKKWLLENGITSKVLTLEVFDYISERKKLNFTNNFKVINYAGNLKKASFLEKKFTNLRLNIYGTNYNENLSKYPNYLYKGEYTPEELPLHINEGFGLIWDGMGSEEPTGVEGNYLKYINPHKFSLYLRCGIPVIAWSKSAIGKFINENQVGFLIDNLSDIDEKINDITLANYKVMQSNCYKLAIKLQDGFFTKQAIKEVELIKEKKD